MAERGGAFPLGLRWGGLGKEDGDQRPLVSGALFVLLDSDIVCGALLGRPRKLALPHCLLFLTYPAHLNGAQWRQETPNCQQHNIGGDNGVGEDVGSDDG